MEGFLDNVQENKFFFLVSRLIIVLSVLWKIVIQYPAHGDQGLRAPINQSAKTGFTSGAHQHLQRPPG